MKVVCPYCQKHVLIPESSKVQHNIPCPSCGKPFFAAGELVFRYARRLDLFRGSREKKVACPYCGQHYQFDFQPLNNMLGCPECLKVFVLPPAEPPSDVLPSAETIVLTSAPTDKGNSVFAKFTPKKDADSASSENQETPAWLKDPIPVPPLWRKR